MPATPLTSARGKPYRFSESWRLRIGSINRPCRLPARKQRIPPRRPCVAERDANCHRLNRRTVRPWNLPWFYRNAEGQTEWPVENLRQPIDEEIFGGYCFDVRDSA